METSNPATREEAAKILLETKSVLFNAEKPFVFTSGRLSPVYVDIRRLIAFPDARKRLMDMAADILGKLDIDYMAGGETAGIPYAAFIAERLHKPMLYVRKKPKGFGRMAQIEGALEEDHPKVALIEDLQTDGGSKKVFIDVLREAGATVEHSFVVFHYGNFPQSLENMKELGVQLHALTDWWAVLEAARMSDVFSRETLASVEFFLKNPDEWATQNAHLAEAKSSNG
ncbi:MAG: orotate phosphoribosyltransferase [Pseudobdellovibrionaceae bacterium]